jgi:hypothetical protein
MQEIFADFIIEILEPDPQEPGVFLKSRKPPNHQPADLSVYRLYSMVTGTYVHSVEGRAASKYEGKLVRSEGHSPEDSKVYLVREGLKQWIIDSAWLAANGFRWPDDVTVIASEELDQIPSGDPLH